MEIEDRPGWFQAQDDKARDVLLQIRNVEAIAWDRGRPAIIMTSGREYTPKGNMQWVLQALAPLSRDILPQDDGFPF